MGFIGCYLAGALILALTTKESYGLVGAGPAPLIYLTPANNQITDDVNTGTPTVTAGSLGRIAYSNFGSLISYYYVRDGVVDNQVMGGATSTILNDVGVPVIDIATCCGRLFAVHSSGDGNYMITVYFSSFTYILFQMTGRACPPRIAIDCNNRILFYTTDRGINQWDFSDINMNEVMAFSIDLAMPFPEEATYGSCPLDLTYAQDGSANPVLFFSLMNSAKVFRSDSGNAPMVFKDFSATHAAVTYLAADANCLYYGSLTGTVHAIHYQSRTSPGDPPVELKAATEASGITVCEGGCAETCPASCTTCVGTCGLCLPGAAGATTPGTCVCDYLPQSQCFYSGAVPDLPVSCKSGPTPEALMCAIVNPVAERRAPARSIEVHALYDTAPQGQFAGATYTTEIRRRVKTGRWPDLPRNSLQIQYTGNANRGGMVFKAQPRGRGQRFGVYAAQAVQSNGRAQGFVYTEALCVAQENSRLYSPVYTVIASPNDMTGVDVELKAYVPRDRLRRIEWSRTDIQTGVRQVLGQWSGRRAITIAKDPANTGIYEAYVSSRYLRTWHAIFHVIIRRCGPISHGLDCGNVCAACTAGRGVCDETSGSCQCLPGYQDTVANAENCGNPCTDGMVGQNCNINCETELGKPGCRDVLFCSPHPVGCHCYRGLEPPYCSCPAGMFGQDCASTCACAANQICDSRFGCIADCINSNC